MTIDTLQTAAHNLYKKAADTLTSYNTPENRETVEKVALCAGIIIAVGFARNYFPYTTSSETKQTSTPTHSSSTPSATNMLYQSSPERELGHLANPVSPFHQEGSRKIVSRSGYQTNINSEDDEDLSITAGNNDLTSKLKVDKHVESENNASTNSLRSPSSRNETKTPESPDEKFSHVPDNQEKHQSPSTFGTPSANSSSKVASPTENGPHENVLNTNNSSSAATSSTNETTGEQ